MKALGFDDLEKEEDGQKRRHLYNHLSARCHHLSKVQPGGLVEERTETESRTVEGENACSNIASIMLRSSQVP